MRLSVVRPCPRGLPALVSRTVHAAARSAVALAAVAWCAVALVAARPLGAQAGGADRRPTVAVLYFTNAAMVNRDEYAPLSKGLAEMLITELGGNPAIRVVERDRIEALFAEQDLAAGGRVDQATAVRIGQVLGARHLLFGSFVVDPRQAMRMDLRAINAETSELEFATAVTGKADRLLELLASLGAKVNAGLRLPAIPSSIPAAPGIGTSGPNQLRSMMLLSRALEQQDRRNIAGAIALMKESLAANPENARARTILATLEATPR
jgi:TolB-like protein